MTLFYLLVTIIAFAAMWLASELIVNGIKHFSHQLGISTFSTSFFVLGLLTSIPELSIGVHAVLAGQPEVYVGTLIGASIVLFLLVIPVFAIGGNGVRMARDLPEHHLILSLFIILLPAFLAVNGRISLLESIVLIALYVVLFLVIEKRQGILEKIERRLHPHREGTIDDAIMVIGGIILVFTASKVLLMSLPLLAQGMGVPPAIISILVFSVGTNLPEILIGVQAIRSRNKDIALGDYIGSAAANSLLFGLLTIMNGPVYLDTVRYMLTFQIFLGGLVVFYLFARSKHSISRKEGYVLLLVYLLFLVGEFLTK